MKYKNIQKGFIYYINVTFHFESKLEFINLIYCLWIYKKKKKYIYIYILYQ